MKVQKKIFKGTLSLLLSFILMFTALFSTSFADSSTSTSTNKNILPTANTRSGNYMFYSSGTRIYKINVYSKKKTSIYKCSSSYNISNNINVYKGYVYFVVNKGSSKTYHPYIYRIKTDGKYLKNLAKGDKITPYLGKIYYRKVDFSSSSYSTIKGIYKMSLTGSQKTVIKYSSQIKNLIIYKSYIYYVSGTSKSNSLYRISTSGKYNSKLLSYTNKTIDLIDMYSSAIIFDLYNSDNSKNTYIYDTKTKEILNFTKYLKNVDLNGYDVNILATENNYFYFTFMDKSGQSFLFKCNLSSNKDPVLLASGNTIFYCEPQGDYLYYYDFSSDYNYYRLYLIKSDGTHKTYLCKYKFKN